MNPPKTKHSEPHQDSAPAAAATTAASGGTWALLPVKHLARAKSRLRRLSARQRGELARLLLRDQLALLTSLAHEGHFAGVAVVSADPQTRDLAQQYGAVWIAEAPAPQPRSPSAGSPREWALNAALDAAARELHGRGADRLLLLPIDLPLLQRQDVLAVLATQAAPVPNGESPCRRITVVPDRHEDGTNALLVAPPTALHFAFGAGSARAHLDQAEPVAAASAWLHSSHIALDLDTDEDLDELLANGSGDGGNASRALTYLRQVFLANAPAPSSGATSQPTQLVEQLLDQIDPQELGAEGNAAVSEITTALSKPALLPALLREAAAQRDEGWANRVSFSKKVFLPLTHLCRDICHYCVFAQAPKPGEAAFLTPERLLALARPAAEAGCKEALFTLGDKPELRWSAAREALAELGHETTLGYLAEAAQLVHRETGLLPHLNPGLMGAEDLERMRPLAPSMGIMLESVSRRLLEKGQAHYGCPDKEPAARLETLRLAGEAQVPFTSGLLIGIGETRAERIEALLALRALHLRYGHLQEIIIQNFRAKPQTRMAHAPEPPLEELLWTLAVTRLVFGPQMSVQAPPNLSPGALQQIVGAGINDWGGVSPVTPDFVNPEAPWPHLEELRQQTEAAGKELLERLTVYPEFALQADRWLAPEMRTPVQQKIDASGYARAESWSPGAVLEPPRHEEDLLAPTIAAPTPPVSADIASLLRRAEQGEELAESDIVRLFDARGRDFRAVCDAADGVRQRINGNVVTYVVNRNINYTNVCYFKCQFCAFSKGKLTENLRGKPYDLELPEIQRRVREAWERGATEVCMQGGIHPDYTGETYLAIVRAVKEAAPKMHVHAFSPLEVWQGAATLGLPLDEYLQQLVDAGLGTLPGTAAEILDDAVREVLCPDKIKTDQWLEVMETAHGLGIRTTATIMYGHVEQPVHWARHLLRLRGLQLRTGGFTEFVPLPFVPMEAPIYLKGKARQGPTFREAVLLHAVARLVLAPHFENIQASWVKMGPRGVAACLRAGVNDLGGSLMNESITRAAGAAWGEELPPEEMEELIRSVAGRIPQQRTTTYGAPPDERITRSFGAPPLGPIVNSPARKYERTEPLELVRPGLE